MSLILIAIAVLGIALLLLAVFLRENKVLALVTGAVGLLMTAGGVGVFLFIVNQMR